MASHDPAIRALNQAYAQQKWIKPDIHQHELSHMGIQVLTFANGKTAWFIDNEYGDRARDLALALKQIGVKQVVLMGTAASLRPDLKLGSVVSPDRLAPDNPTSSQIVQGKVVHGHVDAIALEDQHWLAKTLTTGVHVVEVEAQPVASVLSPDVLKTYLIISDVLVGASTRDYTHWTDNERRIWGTNMVAQISKQYLQGVGVMDIHKIADYKLYPFINHQPSSGTN